MGRFSLRLPLAVTLLLNSPFAQGQTHAVSGTAGFPNPAGAVEQQQGYQPLLCAMHIHSRYSNGQYEIFELAAYAHQRKIDVLGITDSFLTQARYGVGPLRKLVSRSVSRDGVLSHGIGNYLAEIETAKRRFPHVILLPGLEVTPYYYWRGSYSTQLSLFNFDRHFLIFGLRDLDAIRNIPVIENETWANTPHDWSTAVGPGTLLVCGIVLLFLWRTREIQLTHFTIRKRQRFRLLPAILLLLGGLWGFNEYPFGRLSDPYSGKHDAGAYQRVVDYVERRGGLTYWSYPEARYGDVSVAGARMISTSHPEDLGLVDEYNGFEGLYGGPITVTQPGNVWDHLLTEYRNGGRRSWPSAITGIDFHFLEKEGGWYELNRGQTILWVKIKDEASVLEAMRRGRGYAAFQAEPDRDLIFRNYAVRSECRVALAGESLRAGSSVNLTATVDWNRPSLEPTPRLAELEIVLDGSLADRREVPLPINIDRTDTLAPGRHYYRVRVKYGPSEVLSNPIFVEVG